MGIKIYDNSEFKKKTKMLRMKMSYSLGRHVDRVNTRNEYADLPNNVDVTAKNCQMERFKQVALVRNVCFSIEADSRNKYLKAFSTSYLRACGIGMKLDCSLYSFQIGEHYTFGHCYTTE